jgi:hypothetical protein
MRLTVRINFSLLKYGLPGAGGSQLVTLANWETEIGRIEASLIK